MAIPENHHCANCIGTLSFSIITEPNRLKCTAVLFDSRCQVSRFVQLITDQSINRSSLLSVHTCVIFLTEIEQLLFISK